MTARAFVAAIGLLLLPVAAAARLNDPTVRGDGCLSDFLATLFLMVAFVMFRNFRWRKPGQ